MLFVIFIYVIVIVARAAYWHYVVWYGIIQYLFVKLFIRPRTHTDAHGIIRELYAAKKGFLYLIDYE